MPDDYVPYGPEWKAEMMRMRKAELIDMVRRIMAKQKICSHAKIKRVVCDCGVKGDFAYGFIDCDGAGTYSAPGNNGFGYSRQCGKVANKYET